jgi:hypothetical protein
VFNFPFEVEHIIPPMRGGSHDDGNLALACRSCNVRKDVHTNSNDAVTGAVVGLFNPRQQLWQDHFSVDASTGTIEGRTPAGRATAARLSMNNPVQLEARRLWIELGLFP